MNCPYCTSEFSKVTNKRKSPEGIRRRRECLKCKKRFTTQEKSIDSDFFVIKKDLSRERFDRGKLKRGIYKAFEKRPVSPEKIEALINGIEELLRRKGAKEIKSSFIGELVMRKIKMIDNVAYIRFASVYRDFQDINDFKLVIKQI